MKEEQALRATATGEQTITAFTDLGAENLAQLVKIYKADPGLMARYPKGDWPGTVYLPSASTAVLTGC